MLNSILLYHNFLIYNTSSLGVGIFPKMDMDLFDGGGVCSRLSPEGSGNLFASKTMSQMYSTGAASL